MTAISTAAKQLADIKSKRNVSNVVLARALGVEPWTIGAWLNGTREISEKHRDRITELAYLPATSDLVIAPLASKLASKIRTADDGDANHIIEAVTSVTLTAGRRLVGYAPQKINLKQVESLEAFAQAFDDASLVNFSSAVSRVINERLRISSLTVEEYAKECIEAFNGKSHDQVFAQFIEPEILSVDYNCTFNAEDELSENASSVQAQFVDFGPEGEVEGRSVFNDDGECVLEGDEYAAAVDHVKDIYVDHAHIRAEVLFQNTAFVDSKNQQWVNHENYIIPYDLNLGDPRSKLSLYLIRTRLGI